MAEYLLPMIDAFRRFMPEVASVADRTSTYSRLEKFNALVVEGDLDVPGEGYILTTEMVPAFKDAPIGALFVTGSINAPRATVAEPDIDWSPLFKVKGNVVAKNLCLAGSASEIDGDLTVVGVLLGYYNHGQMRVRGRTRAHVVIASDYEFIFHGPVERRYVAGWHGKLNIPVDYEQDRLHLILVPEIIDETNFVHDGVILDRLRRGLPVLRPEAEIGTEPAARISVKGAARLAELAARKAHGEPIVNIDLAKCELRFVPDQLRDFNGARELVLSGNRVKGLPSWIGEFTSLEVLGAADCGLATLPAAIARLPRLRKLELVDNPITALPFGPDAYPTVEILSIGEGYQNHSAQFTARLNLAQFPWLRVIEQRYDINTVKELEYRDSDELWTNPHLEILDIGWPALKDGIPAGLLKAHNLRALATRINSRQLGSALWRLPYFEQLEYLAIGHTDLTRIGLARLYGGLPQAFITCEGIDGKYDWDFAEQKQLEAVENDLGQQRFPAAIAALDDIAASLNLRHPMLPLGLHARLLTLCVQVRRKAAEAERDKDSRELLAEAAAQWADRVLAILPANAEACWYLDHHKFWLVRLQCLMAKAIGLALRGKPDASGAGQTLDLAQAELDRFLLPVNPHWHRKESALVRSLRIRIPG